MVETKKTAYDSDWWEEWVYKEVVLPAEFVTRTHSHKAESLGHMYTYTPPNSKREYRLWIYVGVLFVENNIKALLDIAMRGDALARGRAILALSEIVIERGDKEDYLKVQEIIDTWVSAEDYTDTIDISQRVIYAKEEIQTVVLFAKMACDIFYGNNISETTKRFFTLKQGEGQREKNNETRRNSKQMTRKRQQKMDAFFAKHIGKRSDTQNKARHSKSHEENPRQPKPPLPLSLGKKKEHKKKTISKSDKTNQPPFPS